MQQVIYATGKFTGIAVKIANKQGHHIFNFNFTDHLFIFLWN